MRRVHVTNLKSCALTRKTAWPEGRKASLVSDLRQRVRLVHELRKLRRTKEFPDRGGYRFRINQVSWHRGKHVLLNGHFFLDRPFHAFESDPKLIFKQFTNSTYPTIAEMIDVVLHVLLAVPLHPQKIIDDFNEISCVEKRV